MKKESGITLINLIIYVIGLTVITGVVTVITNFFFSNIVGMDESASSAAEYSKFNIAFIDEIKTPGIKINEIDTDHITFSTGNTYSYRDGKIYKNAIAIANEIKKCEFSTAEYEKKNVVSVDVTVGEKGNRIFSKN